MIWHPSEFDLALVNSGDLPGWRHYLVKRHLQRCAVCSERAHSYGEVSGELRRLSHSVPEAPEWLAIRVLAASATPGVRHAFGVSLRLASATALLLLICLAVLLVGQRAPLPDRLDYQVFAGPDAVVGELISPQGRQRLVLYTGMRRGPVEVSTAAGTIGISYADPDTGAVTITRISLEE